MNFQRMTDLDLAGKRVLIREDLNVPVKNGEITTITYGLKLDMAKPAGKYSTSVIYTATPQTD